MRKVGQISSLKYAKLISLVLQQKYHIENKVRDFGDVFEIWVIDEDRVREADTVLHNFRINPESFISMAEKLPPIQNKQAPKTPPFAQARRRASLSDYLQLNNMGKLSIALIIVSVIVGFVTSLGDARPDIVRLLSFSDYAREGKYIKYVPGFTLILEGQVWRLITPIFLHFGFIHILFNSLWIKDLGSIIEQRLSSVYLAGLVLLTGIASNSAQYLVSGPTFGGLSGVVYGLLGFLWIRGKFDRNFGIQLNPSVVRWMIAWFFICLTGLLGPIANTAHGVGAVSGMVWGYLSSKGDA